MTTCDKPITFMRPSVRWPDVLTADSVPCSRDKHHPGMCSNIPDEPGQYASVVTHLLIIKEDGEWFLDGRDDDNNYTEACWSYDTWAEAMADVPDFIRALSEDYSVTIQWRRRCLAMCAGGGYAFVCTRWQHESGHHVGRAIPLGDPSPVTTGVCDKHCTEDHDHALFRSQS